MTFAAFQAATTGATLGFFACVATGTSPKASAVGALAALAVVVAVMVLW